MNNYDEFLPPNGHPDHPPANGHPDNPPANGIPQVNVAGAGNPQANGLAGQPLHPIPPENGPGPHQNGPVAQENAAATGAQANGLADQPLHPIPPENGPGPQQNGPVAQENGPVPQANAAAGAGPPVNNLVDVGLQGFIQGLTELFHAINRMDEGINFLENEPFFGPDGPAVQVNRPATLTAMHACVDTIDASGLIIHNTVEEIQQRAEDEPAMHVFMEEAQRLRVAMRLINTATLALTGYLVFNGDCRVDRQGTHGLIQDGLAYANTALALFQHHIARFLGRQPDPDTIVVPEHWQ